MLNSVDFVTMLPRTAEAADIQGREMSQLQHAASQPGVQFQHKTQENARRTVETKKAEIEDYTKKEGSGHGAGYSHGQKKKKSVDDQKKDIKLSEKDTHRTLDITI